MGLLTRVAQIAAKVNTSEGVAENLVAADASLEFKDDQFSRMLTRYERGVKRPGLSSPKDLVGIPYGSIPITVELVGGGASTRAVWHDLLQACGFSKTGLKAITCVETSVSDKFVPGSIFGNNAVQGSATHSGRIEWVGIVGSKATIVYKPILGTFADLDVLTGYHAGGSGSTMTQNGAAAACGWVFDPMSETASQVPPDLTLEFRDGEDINRLVGARGDVELTFNWGEVPLGKFKFEGPRIMQNVDGTPVRGAFIANVTAPAAPTYIQGNVGLPCTFDGVTPVLRNVSFKTGNTLTPDKTKTSGGVIQFLDSSDHGGYRATRITARKMMISIDPNRPGFATYDWLKKWQANADIAGYIQNGYLAASGDSAIVLRSALLSVSNDSLGDADQNGIRSFAGDLKCNSLGIDDEVAISHIVLP